MALQCVAVRDRLRLGELAPLNRMCRRGSRMHLCGMRLLIQMSFLTSQSIYYVDSWMTRCGTGRALKGNFIATVMFQASLQRRISPWNPHDSSRGQYYNPHSAKVQRGKTACLLDAQQVRTSWDFGHGLLLQSLGSSYTASSLSSTTFKTIFY